MRQPEIDRHRAAMRNAIELLLLRRIAPNDPRVAQLEGRLAGYLVPRRSHQA